MTASALSHLSEQERIRRESLEEIRNLGIDPYPAETFPVNARVSDILSNYSDENPEVFSNVAVAGRLMSRRIQGKASFAEIMDGTGRMQLYLNRDELCPGENKDLYNLLFKKLLDIGDHIGVKGFVFRTRMGEITLHVTELVLLSKSLRPLPVVKTDADGNVHDAFS